MSIDKNIQTAETKPDGYTMDFIQKVTGKRKDNDEFVTGSLMYDYDQDCWRIITYFFDIEEPKLDNQFGVCAHEVYLDTVEPCL